MRYVLILSVLLAAGCAKEPNTAQPRAPYTGPPLMISGYTPPPMAPAYRPTIICSHVGNFTICN